MSSLTQTGPHLTIRRPFLILPYPTLLFPALSHPTLPHPSSPDPTLLHPNSSYPTAYMSTFFAVRSKQWVMWIFTPMWIDFFALLTVAAECNPSLGPSYVASLPPLPPQQIQAVLLWFCSSLYLRCLMTSPWGLSSRGGNKGSWRVMWEKSAVRVIVRNFHVVQMYLSQHAVVGGGCGVGPEGKEEESHATLI